MYNCVLSSRNFTTQWLKSDYRVGILTLVVFIFGLQKMKKNVGIERKFCYSSFEMPKIIYEKVNLVKIGFIFVRFHFSIMIAKFYIPQQQNTLQSLKSVHNFISVLHK